MFCLCNMYIKCFLVLFFIGFIEADFRYSSESCSFPRLLNGKVRVRQRYRLVKFTCLQNFDLVGNKYATCSGREWDVPLPVCVRPGCDVPQIENGIPMVTRGNAWVVYFCLPGHRMVGGSTIYCDGRKWNGTAPTCVDSSAAQPLSCDFEKSDLCGWRQDELHDFDWRRFNRQTPSSFMYTGPSYDHTYGQGSSGYYMYIESTGRYKNDTARLISPLYDRSLTQNGCFVFYYHMYGKTTGGLRVYQKPESFQMLSLLLSSDRKKYILFEKWGNQGDEWFEAVLPLIDVYDNFQIIIEGIRGTSSTSDIAIDDVAILQGSNCTAALAKPSAAPTTDTCVGRCHESVSDQPENGGGCGCTGACFIHNNCCPDFVDVCMFVGTETSDDGANSTEIAPQTQKLVATSPETTTTSTTSVATTTTTTTTTARPTTRRTPSTRPPTKPTTRPTTKRTQPTTTTITPRPRKTTASSTTQRTTVRKLQSSTQKTTTLKTNPPATSTKSTTSTSTTTSTTTKVVIDYSRPIEDHEVYKDMVEKAKEYGSEEDNRDNKVVASSNHSSGSSGAKIGLTLLGVILSCCGLAWLVMMIVRSRGYLTIARFRGQVTRDPEVRYLSTDVDDD